jgi:hypothetical protein
MPYALHAHRVLILYNLETNLRILFKLFLKKDKFFLELRLYFKIIICYGFTLTISGERWALVIHDQLNFC